jgi:hypothetical protein
MKIGAFHGWALAAERARELWPEIPSWAFEMAGEQEAGVDAWDQADWLIAHPAAIAERAMRLACAAGWRPDIE